MVDRSHRDTFRGRILSFIWLYAMQKKRHAHHVSCYGLWESCGSCRGAEGSQATSGFSLCLGEMSVILKSEKERSFLDADVPSSNRPSVLDSPRGYAYTRYERRVSDLADSVRPDKPT